MQNYPLTKVKCVMPKVTPEVVKKSEIVKMLIGEVNVCYKYESCKSFINGIELAIALVNNMEAVIEDRILKYYVVVALREYARCCAKYGMKTAVIGMTHSWLLVEHMKGEL